MQLCMGLSRGLRLFLRRGFNNRQRVWLSVPWLMLSFLLWFALWPVASASASAARPPQNLVLVTVDGLRWQELFRYLLVKYMDGNVKKEKDGVFERNQWGFPVAPEHPPYPEGWRRLVVQEKGDTLRKPSPPPDGQ